MRKLAAAIVIAVLTVPALAYGVPRITGDDVVDESLTGRDIDEATLGQVPSAARADRASVEGWEVRVSQPGTVEPGQASGIGVRCPAGKRPVGGGYWLRYAEPMPNDVQDIAVTQDRPWSSVSDEGPFDGWTVAIRNDSTKVYSFEVYAVCVFAG